ncbi:hypothetical protein [Piscirickettsia salmonis]|uniref:hypothetical protein n=1 Tax=Piscirickettsia salmonis TaxID=1238 RepID=UPI0007C98374|nr:hypothetical protein A0O36_02792 [Piscirickettsiaceae bacterium NZ-RLO1]
MPSKNKTAFTREEAGKFVKRYKEVVNNADSSVLLRVFGASFADFDTVDFAAAAMAASGSEADNTSDIDSNDVDDSSSPLTASSPSLAASNSSSASSAAGFDEVDNKADSASYLGSKSSLASSNSSLASLVNFDEQLEGIMENPFQCKEGATLSFMQSNEGVRYSQTIRFALRLMILDRVRRESHQVPFTPEVFQGMKDDLEKVKNINFPEVSKVDFVKKVGYLGVFAAGAAVFTYASVEDSKAQVKVGPFGVGASKFFGTSSGVLGAMALDKAYELFHIVYPFSNISGQELERVVAEQMGDGPEQKSGCLAKMDCLAKVDCSTEVPDVELDIPVPGCATSDVKIDMPDVELDIPVPGCSPCLFMAAKDQSASNDAVGAKNSANAQEEVRVLMETLV